MIPSELNNASMNEAADYYYYKWGTNYVPANTRNKKTWEKWKILQATPLVEEQHKQWNTEGACNNGIALVMGKFWNNPLMEGKFLNCIDLDNKAGIDAYCTRGDKKYTLEELAQLFPIEQHADDPDRCHVYVVTNKRPLKNKGPNEHDKEDIPAIEVHSKGLIYCTPSVHERGYKYQFVYGLKAIEEYEAFEPDKIEKFIDNICSKHNISYLLESDTYNEYQSFSTTEDYFKSEFKEIIKKGSRHKTLIKKTNWLINRFRELGLSLDQVKNTIEYTNKKCCEEPLPDTEIERIFNDSVAFQSKKIDEENILDNERFRQITNNVHYQLSKNPPTYIVAYRETRQVVEVTIRSKSHNDWTKTIDTKEKYLFEKTTFLACMPIKIVRHKNPLAFLQAIQKYSMVFVDRVDEKHTFRQKTLAEIVQQLRDLGYVLSDGADKALNALLQAFIENKFIEDNEETDYIGFFKDNNKENGIFASNVEIKKPPLSKLVDAINFLANGFNDKGFTRLFTK